MLGDSEGDVDGTAVGRGDGGSLIDAAMGGLLGTPVGSLLGEAEGDDDGIVVGRGDGSSVGVEDGFADALVG